MDVNIKSRVAFSRAEFLVYLERAASWVVCLGMLIYGGAKGIQFAGAADVDTPLNQLSGMQLMWAFYGYSKTLPIIVGVLEVSGGLMLLFRQTRLLGAFMLTTVLVNIILQDMIFGVLAGALYTAIFYQLLLVLIFILNKKRIIKAIQELIRIPKASLGRVWWIQFIITTLLAALLLVLQVSISHF